MEAGHVRRPGIREMSPRARRLARISLSAFSLLFALVGAELLLRAFHPVEYYRPEEPREHDGWESLLHRPSSVPGLTYELAPNRRRNTHGAPVRTNRFGMRDTEPRAAAGAPLHRLVAIGDSVTFGFGVRGEDTYPNVLERLLDETAGDESFDVLNLGVAGYSTRDEAQVFEHKVLRWNPELVVVGYVLNDPEIDPIQPLHRHFEAPAWWQRFELCRLVASLEHSLEVQWLGEGDYIRYLHASARKWRSVVEGFEKIGALGRARKIPVLLLIFPWTNGPWADYPYGDLHRQVAAAAKANRIEVLDLLGAYSELPPERLMVEAGDAHPSKLGHEIAARAIREWMSRRGLLPPAH